MALQLTEEMRNVIRRQPDLPISVVDPETRLSYVLLPADTFERVRALLYDDSDAAPDELLPLAHEAFQQDWDAPGMDEYADYGTRLSTRSAPRTSPGG